MNDQDFGPVLESSDPEFDGSEFEVGMDPDEEAGPDAIVSPQLHTFPTTTLTSAREALLASPDLKNLVNSVARIYPIYGDYVKCPTAVALSPTTFVTSWHGVASAILRHGSVLDRTSSALPFTFDDNAAHYGLSRRVRRMNDLCFVASPQPSGKLDICPRCGAEWRTSALTSGTDLAFLHCDQPHSNLFLEISTRPLEVGEEITLCAYSRMYVSPSQAKQWLGRASEVDLSKLGIMDHERAQIAKSRGEEVRKRVAGPLSQGLDEATESLTKVISQGQVLDVGNFLATCNVSSNTGCSGGAYVRKSEPNKLVGIHLGLPTHSDFKHGNYNLLVTVEHPIFKSLLKT